MSTAIAIHREQTLAQLRQRSALKYQHLTGGMEKEAALPLIAAAGHALRWGATRAAPWLGRKAVSAARWAAPGAVKSVGNAGRWVKSRLGIGTGKLRANATAAGAAAHRAKRVANTRALAAATAPAGKAGRTARRISSKAEAAYAKARAARTEATGAYRKHQAGAGGFARLRGRYSKWRRRRRQVAAGRAAQVQAAARGSDPLRFAKGKSMQLAPGLYLGEGMTGRAVVRFGNRNFDVLNDGARLAQGAMRSATPGGRIAGMFKGLAGHAAGGAAFQGGLNYLSKGSKAAPRVAGRANNYGKARRIRTPGVPAAPVSRAEHFANARNAAYS